MVLAWAPAAFAQGAKDAKLALKAQKALYQDPALIEVEVQSMMQMIYLRGSVPTDEASTNAEKLANVKGAKEVRNRLKVAEPDVASAPDDTIKAKIDEAIADDEDLAKAKLDITVVTEGAVKIEGKVSDYTVAGTLINEVRKVSGVRSIDFENLKY
jgi:osmotically-inducible protein OsmY